MNSKRLVSMANQIAAFFESLPDKAQAGEQIAHHIRMFWEPRMRRELIETIEAGGVEDLNPLVRTALLENKAELWSRREG